jgi:sugar-specific transcriptional regulator TrmB
MSSTDGRKVVQKYLQVLGIEPDSTRLYLELVKQGHSSALQLARLSGISRTQVYRHLEALQAVGLVSAEQLSYGILYRALPLENIEGLLADREAKTAAIRRDLGGMVSLIKTLAGTQGPEATVRHYYGVAGLKQANWNLTKADKEFRVFEAAHLSAHLDKAFARRHRERVMERDLITYDLTNDSTVYAKDIEPFEPSRVFIRHIDPEVLAINFEMYIYNDIVTLLDYSKEQPMALEIQHPSLHAMMRQMYDAMWRLGTPIEAV